MKTLGPPPTDLQALVAGALMGQDQLSIEAEILVTSYYSTCRFVRRPRVG